MSSIVLTGGGTAGHCIPHLAILPLLNETFDNICYIGSMDGIERKLMSEVCDYFSIPTVKFQRSLTPKNLLIPIKLRKAVNEAKIILQKIKPSVVFSKGGYVSLPVVIAATKLNVPVIAHESDYTLGLANKLTAKKCDKVLTTFSDTALNLKNGQFVGSPVREELFYADKKLALKKFGFNVEKPVLLIFGGSSGSKSINAIVSECLEEILKKFQVLHICGKGNEKNHKSKQGYYCAEYLTDMASAYKACDFCVSRGGSNALCEIMALKIPSLIIPLGKKVSRGDQIQNARYYKERFMCKTLSDEMLSAKRFLLELDDLVLSKEHIVSTINSRQSVVANKKIADILAEYAK